MKSAAAVQAAAILLLVASAASCEVAKEYSNRVFKPSPPQSRSDTTALRFMDFDSGDPADTVNIKELFSKETKANYDTVSETRIAKEPTRDSTKADTLLVDTKVPKEPTDAVKRGTTRTKRVRQ